MTRKKRKSAAREKGKKWLFVLITAVAVLTILLIVASKNLFLGGPDRQGKSFTVAGGESRPVLSTLLFTGRSRQAYAAAGRYPEIMDQLYCYCDCDVPPFNHVSLLSCFVERHGDG